MVIYSVYVATKDKKEAQKVSRHLLEKKLIACANIFPVDSLYWWKGRIVEDREYALVAKTNKSFRQVEKEIEKIHSYEVPGISCSAVKVNKSCKDWIEKELK